MIKNWLILTGIFIEMGVIEIEYELNKINVFTKSDEEPIWSGLPGSISAGFYTTASRITNPMQEQNPIARNLMLRFGTMKVTWSIFIISILIVLLSLWLIFGFYTSIFHKLTYIIGGMFVSIVQFAVAHTNKHMKLNLITKLLMRLSRMF